MFNKTQCPKQCNSCRLHSFPKRISSNLVNNVVGISEFILNKHLELGYFKNSTKHVIYNPIIKPHFSDKQTNNDLKIGYVGTLAIHKGIELLLNEFVNLKIKASLYIYGKDQGQGYEYVLKKNYQLENVFFMGYQDINLIYSSIDLLIVPSLWSEPFGRIVPEANSFGIPVIVSNKGGLPELISDNRNGLVFDPSIPGDLVNKIKLADSLIKQNSFSFDNRKFLKEEVALHYLRVLSNEL
jgi:glycosyltransferase involved in cell wall biosynthesis